MMTRERKSILFASCTAALLSITKFTIGITSGSMALISSAVDSLLDLIVSIVNLIAIKKSHSPADSDHNYGHGKIEGIAAIFEGLLILVSGGFIIFSSIQKIISKAPIQDISVSIRVMLFSIVMTGIVVYVLSQTKKKTRSLIIKADLMHYKTDFLTNTGIIISLIIIKLTGIYVIDQLIAIGIALYILRGSIDIIREGSDLIMDKSLGKDQEIIDIINQNRSVESYHMLKTRTSGKTNFVDFHLVFVDKEIGLREAHAIADQIEWDIRNIFENPTQVTIHLDPNDDRDDFDINSKLN